MAVQRKGLKRKEEEEENKIADMDFDDQEPDSEFDSESESESDSDYDEEVKLAEPSKNATYNAQGMMDKLDDIKWPEKVNWIEKLALEVERDEEVDVNDDLARELSFYNQALQGTRLAFEKLQSMSIPFLRPSDYYAEMVKTDSHMEKVKGRLLAEKRRTEEAEERRKARESKRLAKEIQSQKLREREKNRKAEFESVKKWRKERQRSGFGDKDGAEMDFGFEDGKPFEKSGKKRLPGVAPGDRSGGKGRRIGGNAGVNGRKRDRKDSKFGFGGKKGLKKQNTAETARDVRGFRGGGGGGSGGGRFKSNGNKKR